MGQGRLRRRRKDAAEEALKTAEESLSLNPRRSRHREDLVEIRRLHEQLSPVVTQVIGMTRAYFDHYDDGLADDPTVRAIAEQLRRAGHDVRLAVQSADASPDPEAMTSAVRALTAPLAVRPPASAHWILVGSVLEGRRRRPGAGDRRAAAPRRARRAPRRAVGRRLNRPRGDALGGPCAHRSPGGAATGIRSRGPRRLVDGGSAPHPRRAARRDLNRR